MDVNKPDDMLFNGYEDSVEDEKANQEAYERSIKFKNQSEEERLKKLSFLTEQQKEEPQEEFLIKPRIGPSCSPKFQIETNLFTSVDKSTTPDKSKSILGILNPIKFLILDEDYVHKPIEFTKEDEMTDLQIPMVEEESLSLIDNNGEINWNEPLDSNLQEDMNEEVNPNIDNNHTKLNGEQHGLSEGHKKRDLKELRKVEENKLEVGDAQQDIEVSDQTIEVNENATIFLLKNNNGLDRLQNSDSEPIANENKRIKTQEEDIFVSNELDSKNEAQEQPIIIEGKNKKSYVFR